MCDLLLLCCKTDTEARGAHGISIFLVDTTTEGFKKGQNLDKIGLKAQDTSELFFEDMRVPHSAILGGDAGTRVPRWPRPTLTHTRPRASLCPSYTSPLEC